MNKKNLRITAAAAAAVFLLVGFIGILNHEPWRDELHSWIIARGSGSPAELVYNKRHEGHPCLWYLCLFAISRFFKTPVAMQLFHLLAATVSAYLFVRFAPFRKGERILFIFGYYPLFEFGILSRNYVLGIVLAILFCLLFRRHNRRHLLLAGILALLMQTSFHGLVIALLLAPLLIYYNRKEPSGDPPVPESAGRIGGDIVILLIGLGLCLASMIPPPDCGIYTGGHSQLEMKRIMRILALFWKSYIPIPYIFHNFWNTNFLDPYRTLQVVVGLFVFVYFIVVFLRRIPILAVYLAGTGIYLAFHYVKFYGYARHHGHLFWLLIICLWLDRLTAPRTFPSRFFDRLSLLARKSLMIIFPLILAANLLAGVISLAMDIRHPFTANLEVVEYIRTEGLEEYPIAGDVDDAVLAFPVFLHRPIYYPRSDTLGTFVTYDRDIRWRKMRYWGILLRIEQLLKKEKRDILIILNYRLEERPEFKLWNEEVADRKKETGNGSGRLVPLREFTDTIVPDEHYFLYLMKYNED